MKIPPRRVVTGHNGDGRSILWRDGEPPQVFSPEAIPGLVIYDLWETRSAPADNRGSEEAMNHPVRLAPPGQGTVFRIVDFPPDASWRGQADAEKLFGDIEAADAVDRNSADPMMHRTHTVDFIAVLSGEIWAVMEEGETCLRPGDVLVQRGTNHSWSVRTEQGARIAVVLVDAAPLEG